LLIYRYASRLIETLQDAKPPSTLRNNYHVNAMQMGVFQKSKTCPDVPEGVRAKLGKI
jgi:hypothetical protein